ncbi:hypothetical protein PAXINDRAFT_172745 [Paxillus involutus ATCC 200175]|uniref:Uncharacterized protein n=1 Tax=Paxillus involutus ATCC 200175 TaxID=664439 RepID=A0A0C9SZT1_PAXIN|nr:hypothetical protein PAXINDRAFT_172745 [Paxillus involutus ATCC 200175]
MRESSSKKERATKHARTQTQGNRTKLKGLGRNVTEDKGLWKLEKNATNFFSLPCINYGWDVGGAKNMIIWTTVHGHISTVMLCNQASKMGRALSFLQKAVDSDRNF